MPKRGEDVLRLLPDYLRISNIITEGKKVSQIWARAYKEPGHEETWYPVTLDDGELRSDGLGRTIGQALPFDVLNIARQVVGLEPISRGDWEKIRQDNQPR